MIMEKIDYRAWAAIVIALCFGVLLGMATKINSSVLHQAPKIEANQNEVLEFKFKRCVLDSRPEKVSLCDEYRKLITS